MSRNEKALKKIATNLGVECTAEDNCTCEILNKIGDALPNALGGVKLKTNRMFYVSEEEADVILTLDMFNSIPLGSNIRRYDIELNAKDIEGKKIRFYYDETDLTADLDSSAGAYLSLSFNVNIKGVVTKPFIFYGEYYGGVTTYEKDCTVYIDVHLLECEALSPITYGISLEGPSFENATITTSHFTTNIRNTNLKSYIEINDNYNIRGYGDPDL